jgi:hypothetical protein
MNKKLLTIITVFFLSIATSFAQDAKPKMELTLCGKTTNDVLDSYNGDCIVDISGTTQDTKPTVNSFTVVLAPKKGEAQFWPVIGNKLPVSLNEQIKNMQPGDLLIITEAKITLMNTGSKLTIAGPSFIKK